MQVADSSSFLRDLCSAVYRQVAETKRRCRFPCIIDREWPCTLMFIRMAVLVLKDHISPRWKSAQENVFFPPDVSLCFFSHYKGLHANSFLPSLSPVCPVSSVSLILYLSASSCVHRLAAPRWIRDLSDRQIKYTATNREGVCRYSASLYSSACAFSVQILSATLCSNRMPLYRALHEVGQREQEHVAWIPNVEVGHAAVGTRWHPNGECSPLTHRLPHHLLILGENKVYDIKAKV